MTTIFEGIIVLAFFYALYRTALSGYISVLAAIVIAIAVFMVLPGAPKAMMVLIAIVYFLVRSTVTKEQEA